MIRSDVMHFCQKYNERLDDFHLGELSCLSLCAIAVSVEPGKAYRRSIYRDFCCLSEDAIRVLLRKYGLSILFSKKGINTDCLKDYAIKKIKSYYPDEEIDEVLFADLLVIGNLGEQMIHNVSCEVHSSICDQLGIARSGSGWVKVDLYTYVYQVFHADFITCPFSRIVNDDKDKTSVGFGLDSIRQGYLFAMALQYFLKDIVGFSSECSQIWKGTSCHGETYEDVALKTFLAIRLSQLSKRRLR